MESVLLQEADADNTSDLDGQFLVVGQHVRADQLDDLHQVIFLQQQVGDALTAGHKVMADVIVVPAAQIAQVFTVRIVPVDGRIVAGVSQGLIQCPEAAGETLGVLGDRLGEIVALGADSADDGDGTFGTVQRLDITGTLVELCQTAGQVGGVAFIGGHLLQTAADLTQSLGPAGGGVGHHVW